MCCVFRLSIFCLLQEHGGDLNSAVDAYFTESNENKYVVRQVTFH